MVVADDPVNTGINVLLVAAKGIAVLSSSSVSLLASLVDSALDLLSTFIILGTSVAMGVKDPHKVSLDCRNHSEILMESTRQANDASSPLAW